MCVMRRLGLTLMEMVIVVALIVAIAALTIPSLQDMYGNYVQESAADAVRAAWADAKSHALDEGRPYRFAIVAGMGNYRIAPDSGDFWASHEMPAAVEGPSALVKQDALPRGIRFADPDSAAFGADESNDTALPADSVSSDQWVPVVTFLPDGTADRNVEIVFQSRVASPLLLKLRAVTGSVTSLRLRPDGSRP
jgi:type II secretory pathway pseudopilin PulG